jgi:hypothetical protein
MYVLCIYLNITQEFVPNFLSEKQGALPYKCRKLNIFFVGIFLEIEDCERGPSYMQVCLVAGSSSILQGGTVKP